MALTEKNNLRGKPFISPQEQAQASGQFRQDSLQNNNIDNENEPIHIGSYSPGSMEQFNAYNSVASEAGISGRLRRAKQEWNIRQREHSQGQMQMNGSGLSSKFTPNDRLNLKQKQKWGKNFDDMASTMGSLKNRARNYKNLQKQSSGGKLASGIEEAMTMPISMATSELLQKSWLNIIDSFGLTLLYINFHVFCRWVFGEKLFCKLGHEWLGGKSGTGKVGGAAAKTESTVAKDAAKGAGSGGGEGAMKSLFGLPEAGMGLLESAVLIIVDAIILFSLMQQVSFYILIIYIVQDPVGAASYLVGAAGELVNLVVGLIGG